MVRNRFIILSLLFCFTANLFAQPALAIMIEKPVASISASEEKAQQTSTKPPCHSASDSSDKPIQADTVADKDTLCCDTVSCDCQHISSVILPSSIQPQSNLNTHSIIMEPTVTLIQTAPDSLYRPPIR